MCRSVASFFCSWSVRRHRSIILGLLLILSCSTEAIAQEVAWRHDYNSARREAQDKGKPLFVDFGTEYCFWCEKMDSTTFRDPAIAALLNERFVPLKILASHNPTLTDALRIQSFPTMVMAAPDGKILGTLEGYMLAARLREHLDRAVNGLNNPEWMTRDYQAATKAIAESDYPKAIALLKTVVEDGKTRSVQVKAQQTLQEVEHLANQRAARAQQLLDKGQTSAAIETVTEILKTFPGTHAASDASLKLKGLVDNSDVKGQQRTHRARELLAQAREDYRTQQYMCCIERCDVLASNYPDLAEGGEAIQLANEIKNNPEWMRQACESLSERLGLLYMSLAETWLNKGQPKQAELILERVIQTFPGSRQADAAQTRLSQIQGAPTQRAGYKR